MTKEEYISQIEEQDLIIKNACQVKKDIKEKYIEANKKFEVGEKVKICGDNERFAFVSDIKINFRGDVDYTLCKIKKDGTMSRHSDWVYIDEIKKIEE
jgi:hypothetical protein